MNRWSQPAIVVLVALVMCMVAYLIGEWTNP